MSFLDKVIAAVTPMESQEERMSARRRAESMAEPGSWFAMILDHHRQLEQAFAETLSAPDAGARKTACKSLGLILTGHAIAEESVVYPAMGATNEKAHAAMGYEEQAMVKSEMALLEKLDPMSQDWTDKLTHIRDAVAHHMYEEEGTWFPELARSGEDQAMITQRYTEEFERYVGKNRPMMASQHPSMSSFGTQA